MARRTEDAEIGMGSPRRGRRSVREVRIVGTTEAVGGLEWPYCVHEGRSYEVSPAALGTGSSESRRYWHLVPVEHEAFNPVVGSSA